MHGGEAIPQMTVQQAETAYDELSAEGEGERQRFRSMGCNSGGLRAPSPSGRDFGMLAVMGKETEGLLLWLAEG
jgi:hypothetical protein